MLTREAAPPEPTVRVRRPPTATRELLFAMASPPSIRSEALWPTWLSSVGASWRRPGPPRSRPRDSRSE